MANVKTAEWTWRFDRPPEAVWTALADTARFNEAAGLPKHRIEEAPQPDGSVIYTGRAEIGPFAIAWRDIPVEWVRNRQFRHAREFHNGPLKTLIATLRLSPGGHGTRADYRIEASAANVVGRLILGRFVRGAGRTFSRLAEEARAYLAGARTQPFVHPPARLGGEAEARLAAARAQLERDGFDPERVRRLTEHLVAAPEVDLKHIRPLRLARAWQAPERETIELCLAAVRAGMLAMQWDLLCPNCRGAKLAVASLDRLPRGAHCGTCNIDYERDFMRNVELSFHPAPAIRRLDEGEFCLFGPMTTPHVAIQQTLAAGEVRDLSADLSPGPYRARGLHPSSEIDLEASESTGATIEFRPGMTVLGPPPGAGIVRLVNRREREATFVVESREWIADALLAHRVASLQAFRELFSTEVLRPGDEVGIGHVTLMFTDLLGSTALYGRIGEAKAYGLVREHFAFLADAVRRHDGAVVKTIGDAVMASFGAPADAMRAALAIQRATADFNRRHGLGSGEAVAIKLGLHGGPCIAVNMNDRLDYFGSTVNLAARLQSRSQGGDIVVSAELARDPGVAPLLQGLDAQSETAAVKGFADPVGFLRIRP